MSIYTLLRKYHHMGIDIVVIDSFYQWNKKHTMKRKIDERYWTFSNFKEKQWRCHVTFKSYQALLIIQGALKLRNEKYMDWYLLIQLSSSAIMICGKQDYTYNSYIIKMYIIYNSRKYNIWDQYLFLKFTIRRSVIT